MCSKNFDPLLTLVGKPGWPILQDEIQPQMAHMSTRGQESPGTPDVRSRVSRRLHNLYRTRPDRLDLFR